MELHIAHLSAAQRDLGAAVTNVFNQGKPSSDSLQIFSSVNLDRIRPQSLRNLLFYAGIAMRVRQLRSDKPLVLHVHGAWSDFVLSKPLCRLLRARATFGSIHGVARPRWRWLYRIALSHCARVFATGKNEQQFLAQAADVAVEHLPSALTDAFVHPPMSGEVPKAYDVISVGNLVPKKRHDLIIEMARRRPTLRFAVVGDGPRRAALEAALSEFNLTNVTLLGHQSPESIAALLRSARVFISTSEEEGSPTSALEAMAVGLPVILAPSNDLAWLVSDGDGGYITNGWSAGEFVELIDRVLSDDGLRTKMGARNMVRARQHTWPTIARHVTALMRAASFA